MSYYRCDLPSENVLSLPTVSNSVSGSIANFNTSLALPLVALKTYIKAQGGGTPTTPVAITGFSEVNVTRAGKNLVAGVIEGGSIGSNGTIAGGSAQYDMVYAPIKAGETYTISTNETTNQFVGGYFTSLPSVGSTSYDGQRIVQYSKTFTAPITGYVVFRQMSGYEYAQLEVGSMATAYVAPNYTEYTIQLGQTVYGGYVDWELGKGVITTVKKKLSDFAWTKGSANTDGDGRIWYHSFSTDTQYNSYPNALCDSFVYQISQQWQNLHLHNYYSISQYFIICVEDTYATSNDMLAVYGDVEFTVVLRTPIEISLPTTMPNTIEGVQNWFADSGDIELEYWQTIKDKLGI